MSTLAPPSLAERYRPSDVKVFEDDERARFVDPIAERSWGEIAPRIAWELCYRKEPELYVRLIAGERIHPAVVDKLPRVERAVEVGAGTGRLTLDLARRCRYVTAVEPARPLRERLERVAPGNVKVCTGFFDALPMPDRSAELVVSCSAFTRDESHGGGRGLKELERVTAPGGTIAFVWPSDVEWLRDRGFDYQAFDGEMYVSFANVKDALELATIFYPDAVDEIARRGEADVPYEVLGINPPRDIAWKTVR